ncbi:hypothetical protein [Streptomyces sp. NPDC020817]|uniref:hypothetical protein n=1 Tax=Streptomyces sp. NPDC020817 TaxID=3365095 RepID=UPI00378A89A8
MGKWLTMPTLDELGPGPVRAFVAEMYFHYRQAKRPSLREIETDLAQLDEMAGTASRETVRRILRGETVPTRWTTVVAVLYVFCNRSGINPDGMRYSTTVDFPEISYENAVRQLWDQALEGDEDSQSELGRPETREGWRRRHGSS